LKTQTLSKIKTRSRYFLTLVLAGVILSAGAEPPIAWATSPVPSPWSLSGVHHLIGLPGVKQRAVGTLWASPQGIRFESGGAAVSLEAASILQVSVGDERALKGGAFGRFIRTGIPATGGLAIGFSGVNQLFSVIPAAVGLAASLATQASEDIVTIEFLSRDGYHGAVFTMPRHAAEGIEEHIHSNAPPAKNDSRQGDCPAAGGQPTALSLLPVKNDGTALPAEYRVLIYEHLFNRLSRTQPTLPVYRAGNLNDHACGGWQLALTAESSRKGDAVKRAFAGPFGLFVATTRLNYRVLVTDSRGASILDERTKAVMRGDSESLDLSKTIAQALNRQIGKLLAKAAAAGV